MAFFAQTGPSSSGLLSERLGSSLGQGIGQGIAGKRKSEILSKALFGNETNEEISSLSPELQIQLAKIRTEQGKVQQKSQKEQQKSQKEQMEARILAKFHSGEKLSPEETAQLSPTSIRSLIGSEKEVFEKESEKLEAKRVSELSNEIEKEYQGAQLEDQRIGRMEKLSEKGNLSTPMMINALQSFNLPIGILSNPDTEEYSKLETDFLRDVRTIFPGGRITNYEIQSYLKTVPSLLNSPKGRAAVIRNRKLQNEAKRVRYDAYKDIIKENGGKRPQNLGILLQEKIGSKLDEIEMKYKEGIETQIDKFQQPINMIDPNGNPIAIPPSKIEQALKAGAKFQ